MASVGSVNSRLGTPSEPGTPKIKLSARLRPASPDEGNDRPRRRLAGKAAEISAALDSQLKSAAAAAAAVTLASSSTTPVSNATPRSPKDAPNSPSRPLTWQGISMAARTPGIGSRSISPSASECTASMSSSARPWQAPSARSASPGQSRRPVPVQLQPGHFRRSEELPTPPQPTQPPLPSQVPQQLSAKSQERQVAPEASVSHACSHTFASERTNSTETLVRHSSFDMAQEHMEAFAMDLRRELQAAEERMEQRIRSVAALLTSKGSAVNAENSEVAVRECARLRERVTALELQLEAELPRGGLQALVVAEAAGRWKDLERELELEREARATLTTKLHQENERRVQETAAIIGDEMDRIEQRLTKLDQASKSMTSKSDDVHTALSSFQAVVEENINAAVKAAESRVQESACRALQTSKGRVEELMEAVLKRNSQLLAESSQESQAEQSAVRATVAELRSKLASLEASAPWEQTQVQFRDYLAHKLESQSLELHQFVELQAAEARAAVESLRKEVPSELQRVVGQAVSEQAQLSTAQLKAVRNEMAAVCEEQVQALMGSQTAANNGLQEVQQELAVIAEQCSARIESMHVSLGSMKTIISKEIAEGKLWSADLDALRREIEECRTDLSKGIVSCQGRLSETRLALHDKVQELEDRINQAGLGPDGSGAALLTCGSMESFRKELADVAKLREFTMDQISKLHNSMADEMSKLQEEVKTSSAACIRDLQSQQSQAAKQLLLDSQAIADRSKQEIREQLAACEARMGEADTALQQFTLDQTGKLWVSVDGLQASIQEMSKRITDIPPSVSYCQEFQEVAEFSTTRVRPQEVQPGVQQPTQGLRKAHRQQHEELVTRLQETEELLQQQQSMVQKHKTALAQQTQTPSGSS